MTAAKRKGTAWESQICDYLRSQGWPDVERRTLNGRQDRGDIAGIRDLVIEAKNCKALDLAGWVDELTKEVANENVFRRSRAKQALGAVVAKRRNRSVSHAYVIMDLETFARLLKEAGY